jgi:trehalose utilization protein
MGLIVLHSGLHSKVFKRLMGTRCKPDVGRNDGEMERIWFLDNRHPILENVGGKYFELEESQVFTEPFSIPTPDELVFVSWNEGGDLFRSGCCFQRENGKIFFFGPGHETHPVYYQPEVQQILVNAVRWAKPVDRPSMEG